MKTRITLLASAILGVLTVLGQGFTEIQNIADMNTTRYGHAAINLDDGRILVVGGHTTGFVLTATAEIYDPVANAWTQFNIPNPHDMIAFVKLNNGNYLFMGGCSSGYGVGQSSVTTIFDPVNTTFTNGPNMLVSRTNNTAARLSNGNVLVVGNWYNTGNAELYDNSLGQFVALGTPVIERSHALVLPTSDGNAYILGGYGPFGGAGNTLVEEFNAGTNTFSTVSNEIFDGETGWYTAWNAMYREIEQTRLSDGRYVFLAYRVVNGETEYTLATFDPVSKTFARLMTTPSLPNYDEYASESWAFWGNLIVDPTTDYIYINAHSNLTITHGERLYTVDAVRGLLHIPTGASPMGYYMASGTRAWLNGNIMYTGGTYDGSNFNVASLVTVVTPQHSLAVSEYSDINAPFFAYPNPVMGTEFYVNLPEWAGGVLEMYNSNGVLVRRMEVRKGTTVLTIPRKGLLAGIYHLRLANKMGVLNTRVVLQ